MNLFTMDKKFLKQDEIDVFESSIWTERYYGDSDFELVVEPNEEMFQKLKYGTFVGLEGSKEVMIVETLDSKEGKLKVTGVNLCQFLNNRFVRVTPKHEDRYWQISGMSPGETMGLVVEMMCGELSPYLDGTIPIGIFNPQILVIHHLEVLTDGTGSPIDFAVPYGPVFSALYTIATTYQIGQQLILVSADSSGYQLQYRSYYGLDRTSRQNTNSLVRFSPQMDSLTDIDEIQSIKDYKTEVYSFAPGNPGGLATGLAPGWDSVNAFHIEGGPSGSIGGPGGGGGPTADSDFSVRAEIIFSDDITTDQVGGDAAKLRSILSQRASAELAAKRAVKAVDGQIVPLHQFQYGKDYGLGDIIEVQGNSKVVSNARVTEYIRSQDNSGEKSYPTVAFI